MSLSESTRTKDTSLKGDMLAAARYYLGNRRALLILAIVGLVASLALNWDWLVAIGLAPILLSTLPCLVMCAFGVCMMCRSGKEQSTQSLNSNDQGAPLASSAVGASQNAAGCYAEPASDANSIVGGRQNPNKTAEQ